MAEKIVISNESRRDFQKLLDKRIGYSENTIEFLKLIRTYNARIRVSDIVVKDLDLLELDDVDNCIARADDFGSVLSHVILNFTSIVSQIYNIKSLYIQNPLKRVVASLESFYPGEIERLVSQYPIVSKNILGDIYKT